ncbi:MAG: RagB/SusD family nutrient uptake outer membrane protein [Bacteroides sp.]|nr:RagB/SusD family nutrient uptake outer membrane protein [Bacteroides sp.]
MKKYISGLLITLLSATGCSDSFLDREPGSYVDATYYTSDAALLAATYPLYNRAWFDYNKRPAVAIGSLMANDAYNPWMNPEFTTFTVTALDNNLSDAWRSFYSVVTMANSVIEAVDKKSGPEVSLMARQQTTAVARLMRGTAYFYMVRLWGPVVLFEDNEEVVKNPIRPVHREEDVFRFVIEDLTYASEYLPERNTKGLATCWAARGMLAKAYLARSGWRKGGARDASDLEMARSLAADVCENSGLKLVPEYEDLFKYKNNNNEESLLAMQWVPLGPWGVCNTLLADLAFSSEVTGGVNVWGGGLNGSPDMMSLYETADSLRRNATFFTQGSYYPYININDGGYTYTNTGASIKKGVIGGGNDDNDGYVESMNSPLNTYILRLADVYLTYAEACLGNAAVLDEGPGLEYFNRVRDRAKVDRKTSITLDDIIRERRIEFSMEYCNWYDMVSWYCYQPDKMLTYFNNQYRGYRANYIKDADGKLLIGNYDDDEVFFLEGPENYTEPSIVIHVTHEKIFFSYPESDVIQNPLLTQDPQPYPFNEP